MASTALSPKAAQPDLRVTDAELAERFTEPKPVLKLDFSSVVVMTGLPKPPAEKLKRLIKLVYTGISEEVEGLETKRQFSFPLGEDGCGAGYAYFRFQTKEQADLCISKFNGSTSLLGEKYPISVYRYDDLKALESMPEEYIPPKELELADIDSRFQYLMDEEARPHFLILTGKDVTDMAFSTYSLPTEVFKYNTVGVENICCSSKGTFIVLQYPDRISLRYGVRDEIVLPASEGSAIAGFVISPCERFIAVFEYELSQVSELAAAKYAVLQSSSPDSAAIKQAVDKAVSQFRWATAIREAAGFSGEAGEKAFGQPLKGVPVCKASIYSVWEGRMITTLSDKFLPFLNVAGELVDTPDQLGFSGTGSYFAYYSPLGLYVYEIECRDLVYSVRQKRFLRMPGITDFQFSPSTGQDMLAVFQGKLPSKATSCLAVLINLRLPDNKWQLVNKAIYVDRGVYSWQAHGKSLALVTERTSKGTLVTQILIVKMLQAGYPVETLDLSPGLQITASCWNSRGSKYAFVAVPRAKVTAAPPVDPQAHPPFYVPPASKTRTNALAFSAQALDAFMSHASNTIVNDGKAAVYILDLEARPGAQAAASSPITPASSATQAGSRLAKIIGVSASFLRFSPAGSDFLVAADTRDTSSEPFFTLINANTREIVTRVDVSIKDFLLDPTGRYILVYREAHVSSAAMYSVYNVAGDELYTTSYEGLQKIVWRPMDTSLLEVDSEKEEEIQDYVHRNFAELSSVREKKRLEEEGRNLKQRVEARERWAKDLARSSLSQEEQRKARLLRRACYKRTHPMDSETKVTKLTGIQENGEYVEGYPVYEYVYATQLKERSKAAEVILQRGDWVKMYGHLVDQGVALASGEQGEASRERDEEDTSSYSVGDDRSEY